MANNVSLSCTDGVQVTQKYFLLRHVPYLLDFVGTHSKHDLPHSDYGLLGKLDAHAKYCPCLLGFSLVLNQSNESVVS